MADVNSSKKFRCDCAKAFDKAPSLAQHARHTGHTNALWCKICRRQFTSEESLKQHKKTTTKHKNSQFALSEPNSTPRKSQTDKPVTSVSKPTKTARIPGVVSTMPKLASKDSRFNLNKPTTAPKTPIATSTILKPATKDPEAGPSMSAVAPKTPKVSQDLKGKKKAQENVTKTPVKGVAIHTKFATNQPTPIAILVESAVTVLPGTTIKYPWASKSEDIALLAALEAECHGLGLLGENGYSTGEFTSRKFAKFNFATFLRTPPKINGIIKRKAIAVDCEMVGIGGGKEELALLCAVDLFSGEVLINTLVLPTVAVKDWRFKWSGVNKAMMNAAVMNGEALDGWPAARAALFEFTDADTILVGHSLNNDLKVLHVSHTRVVDSCILVAEAVFGKGNQMKRRWGLKVLAQELLGAAIQVSKKGHDCLEDTLATRELVLWCLKQPELLDAWATKTLVQYKIEEQKRLEQQKARNEQRAKQKKKREEKEKERQRQMEMDSALSPS